MKIAEKLTFQNVEAKNVLTAEEMRLVRGGAITTTGLVGTCGINFYKNGVNEKCLRGMSKEQAIGTSNDPDSIWNYEQVYWCCDSCKPCPPPVIV